MATIRFYTRSKIEKLVPVHIRYQAGRTINIRLKTPFTIFPKYWNEKKQKLTDNILYSMEFTRDQAKDIEDRFSQLRDAILRESFKLTGPPSAQWLQDVINGFYYRDAPINENLTQYIKRYVAEAKSGKRLTSASKKKFTYGTGRVLTGFMQSFERFCNEKGKQYDFNDIDQDFYNDFIQFWYDRKCSGNYAGRLIKNLKTIMRAAKEEGLHSNAITETRAFKIITEEVQKIYLTENELQLLFDLDLSGNKVYEIARDVFLAGCYCGQRYSDYSKIGKDNIKTIGGRKYIELIQKKTSERCIIPIRPELDFILKKYDYTLPKTHEQKVNLNIKKVAELAKITEVINVEKNKGGLKYKTKVKKCKLVCTHTARRSFCSNAYLSGIKVIDIMKISGHRTPEEFLKYIRIGKQETATALSDHPFFKGNILKIV